MSAYTKGLLITAAGAVCWGISGTCSQYLCSVQNMDPIWLTQIRLLCAGMILLVFSAKKDITKFRGIVRTPRAMLHCVVFGVCGLMFTQFTYTSSINATNSGTATVLQNTSVILVMLVGCIMAKKLPARREVIAIVCCLVGTFLVATHGSFDGLYISRAGFAWGLASAAAAACYILIPQKLMREWGSILPIGWGMFFGGAAFCFLMRVWRLPLYVNVKVFAALAVIVLIGTVCAFVLFLMGTSMIGPARGNMIGCLEPLVATITTAVCLHTAFAAMDIIGFVFIMATVFILAKK